jgi:hypothetical protein
MTIIANVQCQSFLFETPRAVVQTSNLVRPLAAKAEVELGPVDIDGRRILFENDNIFKNVVYHQATTLSSLGLGVHLSEAVTGQACLPHDVRQTF